MDRWSLYDLDLQGQGHENHVFGHNYSYICCRHFQYISYCRLWIDGHCMTLILAFDLNLQITFLGITLVIYVVGISNISHIVAMDRWSFYDLDLGI